MSLRLKTLLIFASAVVLLFAIVVGVAELMVARQLEEILDAFSGSPGSPSEVVSNALSAEARRLVAIVLVSLSATGAILLFLVWFMLDNNVINPLRQLELQFVAAANDGRFPDKLSVKGGGEIAALAQRIEDLIRTVRETEARFRRLFETANDGILLIQSSTGTVTDANPQFSKLTGLKRSLAVGCSPFELMPFQFTGTKERLRRLMDPRAPFRPIELTLFEARGQAVTVEARASIVELDGDAIIQLNFRDITDRKRSEAELRNLSGRLLQIQDEERRRIARELHDSTAQTLSGIDLSLGKLEAALAPLDGKPGAILAQVRELANSCTQELRTLSYLLHPPLLDEAGLRFALQWVVDGFMTRTERVVFLTIDDSIDRLHHELETTVFRIVQESLSNIHKHSRSRRAWISLSEDGENVVLEVRDEGIGISSHKLAALVDDRAMLGVGVVGMRERVRHLNGQLSIESQNLGTLIRAVVPKNPDA